MSSQLPRPFCEQFMLRRAAQVPPGAWVKAHGVTECMHAKMLAKEGLVELGEDNKYRLVYEPEGVTIGAIVRGEEVVIAHRHVDAGAGDKQGQQP